MKYFSLSGTDRTHNFSYLDKMLDISPIDRGGIATNRARLKGDPITLFIIYLDVIGKERYSISDGVSSSEVSEMRLVTASRREGAGEATSRHLQRGQALLLIFILSFCL
jgi:hypothetical protein